MSDIIQEIRSGNKDAVKSVYQQYAKDVYNFAKSITGDHDTALAATKKTFMTLFRNIQQGDEPQNLRTAALKIAYDEAYQLAVPKAEPEAQAEEEPVPAAEEPVTEAPQPEPAPKPEPELNAEPMFQRRRDRYATQPVVVEEEYEEYEEPAYEEEEDDFVPPERPQDAEREEVYMPKGGYETLKIQPVSVDEEYEVMRERRRREKEAAPQRVDRRAVPAPEEVFPEEEENLPEEEMDVYSLDEDEEAYDDAEEEETKPRNKGLFVFCIILNIVLILILLWFLGGLLVNLGVLPDIDLGYSWFNAHIYPLF